MRSSENRPSQNRAEEVRQRRTQRSQQRMSTATRRVTTPIKTRPVIVRGSGFGTPIHQQASTRARRQYYVAMESTGAELRLPAIPVIRPGWRLLSGLLVIVLGIAIFSVMNSPFFRVNMLSIQGLQRLSAAEVEAKADVVNLSIIEVNPQKIEESVAAAFPELTDIQVEIEMPNFVTLTVRERQPVLGWQQDDELIWVDPEGFIFPPRGDAGALITIHTDDDIPLSPPPPSEATAFMTSEEGAANASGIPETGQNPAQASLSDRRAELSLLNATLQLVQKLPEGTQLIYDKENGLGWTDPEGWQVYIGKDLDNFEEKFNLYQGIITHLWNQGQRPTMVSVEHLNAPFYHLEEVEQ